MDEGIPALRRTYDAQFKSIFPIPAEYPTKDRAALEAFSKAITSNLLAGVGYFYGRSIVDTSFSYEWDEEEDRTDDTEGKKTGARLTEPKALLTATPSRSFFPRGFYWFVEDVNVDPSPILTLLLGMKVSIFCISVNGIPTSGNPLV